VDSEILNMDSENFWFCQDFAIDDTHYLVHASSRPAAYAQAGRMDEAKTALAEARRLNP
jgi:hypothetical protein